MPKTLTRPQMGFARKTTGKPTPPVKRKPAPTQRPLSPEERLQEHLEERRLTKGWRENRLTASLKGS
jgi:hypothetical protein